MIYVVSYSGGKDSTALWAWAVRTNLAPRIVVAVDTGWESAGWLPYVEDVSRILGEPCRVVRPAQTFAERVRHKGTFPSRVRRWCTEDLKLKPFSAELDRIREESGDEVCVVVGVRAEESSKRAAMPEREWSDAYDCEMWRPLISWTLADVIAEHHRAGLPLNPLYLRGAERVGCFPCVMASKAEIAMVAREEPQRIDEIRAIESEIGQTMFCADDTKDGKRYQRPVGIDEHVAWARTSRGGRQLTVFAEPSGCARWGICEAPTDSEEESK